MKKILVDYGSRRGIALIIVGLLLLISLQVTAYNSQSRVLISLPVMDANGADLSIDNGEITFSSGNITTGAPVTITATVQGDTSEPSWVKRGIVLDTSESGNGAQYPYVIKDDGIYKMWYTVHISETNAEIYYATSNDRMTWVEHGLAVPKPSATKYAVSPCVLKEEDDTYKMWFCCQDVKGTIVRTYLATSNDGVSWINRGVVVNVGAAGSFDSLYVAQADIAKEDGCYKMYYKAYDSSEYARFGYATSTDGYSWTKHGPVMDTPSEYDNIENPRVFKNDDSSFSMWFCGYQDNVARILKANSLDGSAWTVQGVEVDVGAPGKLDDAMVRTHCVNLESSVWFIYYSGFDGSRHRIFAANKTFSSMDAVCTVSFFLDSVAPEYLLGMSTNVFVPGRGHTSVSIDWTPIAGDHTIVVVVSDVCPSDPDLSNNVASKPIIVEQSSPAVLEISKVKLSGIDEGFTDTYYEWELLITIENTGGSLATDVLVQDVLPAELGLLEISVTEGNVSTFGSGGTGTRSAPGGDGIGPLRATHITWEVGTLEPGQAEQLYMRICTRLNPAGHQEFTSPGIYSLNDGAYAQGLDTSTGDWISAGPTLPITVIIAQKPQRDIVIIGEFSDETVELPRPPILPIRQYVI
jgi:uncharacterized repeat protein (TIGR01451 family)